MEKYIIILVILATIYYIQTQLNNIEGFADAPQTIGGVDDANAINTLAQIAKNLMTGGFTIPGSINLTNNKTKFTLVNDADNCFRVKDDRGGQVLAINDAGAVFTKGDGLVLSGNDLTLKGNQSIGGNLGVGGNLNNNGNGYFSSGKSKVQIGQGYREGGACVYAMGNHLSLGGSTGITLIEGKLVIGGATLSWDAEKDMLVLDKGLMVNNGLAPGNKSIGLITNNIVFGPSGAPATNDTNNQGGIENLLTTPLKNSWIPEWSSLLGPIRGDGAWTQRWGAVKHNGGVGSIATYKDIAWYGQWNK